MEPVLLSIKIPDPAVVERKRTATPSEAQRLCFITYDIVLSIMLHGRPSAVDASRWLRVNRVWNRAGKFWINSVLLPKFEAGMQMCAPVCVLYTSYAGGAGAMEALSSCSHVRKTMGIDRVLINSLDAHETYVLLRLLQLERRLHSCLCVDNYYYVHLAQFSLIHDRPDIATMLRTSFKLVYSLMTRRPTLSEEAKQRISCGHYRALHSILCNSDPTRAHELVKLKRNLPHLFHDAHKLSLRPITSSPIWQQRKRCTRMLAKCFIPPGLVLQDMLCTRPLYITKAWEYLYVNHADDAEEQKLQGQPLRIPFAHHRFRPIRSRLLKREAAVEDGAAGSTVKKGKKE